jgi:hypothetical protein
LSPYSVSDETKSVKAFTRKPHENDNKAQLEEKLAGAHVIDISRESERLKRTAWQVLTSRHTL